MYNEFLSVEVPVIDEATERPTGEYTPMNMTVDDLLEYIDKLLEYFPDMHVFNLLKFHFKRVCPTALIDPYDDKILEMESFCEEYKCLPFPGSMGDQPNKLVEAFNIIRATKAIYLKEKELKEKENIDQYLKKINKGKGS